MQYAINIIPKLQMNPNTVRLWLQRGDIEKLENVVLEGRGTRLLGEHSPDLRTRVFLKGLPNYLTRIGEIHDATIRGSLSEVERLVSDEPRKQLAISKDASGIPLIHKAVYHDHRDIVAWLVKNYPLTSEQKDREGRTALHYCAACTKPGLVWDILTRGGCDASICDNSGNPAAYYLEHKVEIELPWPETMTSRKLSTVKENLEFKPSNIRIWIHNRDIGKLQQVLWEGHGAKLRCETSSNPRVKRFLEAVPFIMGTVKDIHAAVVKNDVETFRKKTNKPVSPLILCSRDNNGLNVLHKASGLGYTGIVHEILAKYPAALTVQDCEGKTPLHYSAVLKDDGAMYALLVANGADENKQDNRQKTPAYYKNRPTEIDVTNLVVVPEAPRVSGSTYPKNWDWRILEAGESGQRQVKRTVRNVDILDRAFGSAEIPSNNCQEAIGTFENDSGGNRKDDLEERIKIAHDKLESKVASLSPVSTESKLRTGEPPEVEVDREPESQAEPDTERETRVIEPTMDQDSEEDSADDDVIVKHSPGIIEGEDDGEHAAKAKYCTGNHPARDDAPDELTNHRHDEKFEPITGEAESNDAVFEDDQVIVGEHEELGEAELNDGSSTTIDPEVEDLVEHGNMEQLAAMVLNGDGRRLVGRHSNNGELQAFIDNVPAYMGKIHAVHIAAREGNLRDLQGALDRRKFAVARDGSSPNGATPLHIAIIFGHTGVIRYLAGRFSETAHAVDRNGRTPLHYAATLADNGHYYSLLLHLGANPLIQDNFGRRAEYYKTNQDDFSHKMLLRDFGAHETIADQMLSDKVPGGDSYSARRDVTETETLATLERCFRLLAGARRGSTASTPTNGSARDRENDIPMFRTDESRYLASSLGEPLMKGLTEVANTRPKDPVTYLATYLYNFATNGKAPEEIEESNVLLVPERAQVTLKPVEPAVKYGADDDVDYPQSPDSDAPDSALNNFNRDEHGQSLLHFAAVRSHAQNGLFQFLQEAAVNIGYRDELYRTARDVAQQAGIQENIEEIDRWVVYLAARGETEGLVELLLEGYDHILDIQDDGVKIVDVAAQRGHDATVEFLQSIPNFARRDEVHRAIRRGDTEEVEELLLRNSNGGGRLLAVGKNSMGRCSLHIATLGQYVDIVKLIVRAYPETLKIGDNLERTALHYAMGVMAVEELSDVLIKFGAKRVLKDLKARQPSYYFMNKSEIERLQEEEEEMTIN
ncbi:uncharacterized protein LOC105688504 isoform X5 [Athalia rosae]|uniref:uncharacterized protein LOC105688504 isoform X5 n=1 Tax=Athalia rosae TaxID=37344 RepID=UPI0020344A40|nr:uncharacterized protein LOC105688504 isoform X5 [Athalia rosae]